MLFYPGYEVVPPFVLHRTDRLSEERFAAAAEGLRARMDTLFTIEPIPFRRQNGGDYLIPTMELRPALSPGRQGFAVHLGDRPDRAG
jgi:NAD(P)H dehydrogenase (quinone)